MSQAGVHQSQLLKRKESRSRDSNRCHPLTSVMPYRCSYLLGFVCLSFVVGLFVELAFDI